jgi:hypothetical protein
MTLTLNLSEIPQLKKMMWLQELKRMFCHRMMGQLHLTYVEVHLVQARIGSRHLCLHMLIPVDFSEHRGYNLHQSPASGGRGMKNLHLPMKPVSLKGSSPVLFDSFLHRY